MTAPSAARRGVVYDVDGILRAGALRHPVQATRALLDRSSRDRRSVLGMAGVLQALTSAHPDTPTLYLTAVPHAWAKQLTSLLEHDGYPPGKLLMRRHHDPLWLLRGGRAHKWAALRRELTDWPQVAWVLVGDDGLHDPDLYADLADRFPDQVAAVALRTSFGTDAYPRHGPPTSSGAPAPGTSPPNVSWVLAPNGEELLPLLQDALGLSRRLGGAPD